MILPSAPRAYHRPPEPPTLTELAPAASLTRQVVAPLLALLLVLAAGRWAANADFSLEGFGLEVVAAARWLYGMNAGSVAFFLAATAACFAFRVGVALREMGWREDKLVLSKMPWSRVEAASAVLERNAVRARWASIEVLAVLVLGLILLVGTAAWLTPPDGPRPDTAALAHLCIVLLPAVALSCLTSLYCTDLLVSIRQRKGDVQLTCPTQSVSLRTEILAAHAEGHFDTPEAQAAFEAWQLRRKPD